MDVRTDTLLKNFLTAGGTIADPEDLRRIKLLNIFELAFVIAAPFLGLFYFYVGAFSLFYGTVIAGLLGIAVMLVLRTLKNPKIVGNIALFILWALIVFIRWHTGGISENGLFLLSWIWNGGFILLAIYLMGYHWGALWSCLVFVETGYAFFLHRTGHEFTNLIPSGISLSYSLGSYLMGLLFILALAFLFEKERDDARLRESEKSRMLTDSKKYIEEVLERLPIPTFVLDKNHRVVQWNKACRELTGVDSREIIGKRVWNGFEMDAMGSMADQLIDHPETFSENFADSLVSKTESGAFAFDALLPKIKGGMRAIINTAPIVDQSGEVKGAIQTIQELSAQKDDQKTHGDFSGVGSQNMAFPAYKLDSDGKINAWNKACEESYGYDASEMIGKSALSLLSKAYRKNFRDTILTVFKGETVTAKEWKYKTRDGKPVYVLAHLYPLSPASDKIQECLVVNPDITKLKLKLKKLGRYATELKEDSKRIKEEYKLLKSNIASFIRKRDDEA